MRKRTLDPDFFLDEYLVTQPFGVRLAEAAGYNCAMVGPNTDNCDFRLFSLPELTRAWERGKARGEKQRREP